MNKKTKKKIMRGLIGYPTIVVIGAIWGVAALGMAPFDRGITMRGLGYAIGRSGTGVLYDIHKWTNGKDIKD